MCLPPETSDLYSADEDVWWLVFNHMLTCLLTAQSCTTGWPRHFLQSCSHLHLQNLNLYTRKWPASRGCLMPSSQALAELSGAPFLLSGCEVLTWNRLSPLTRSCIAPSISLWIMCYCWISTGCLLQILSGFTMSVLSIFTPVLKCTFWVLHTSGTGFLTANDRHCLSDKLFNVILS